MAAVNADGTRGNMTRTSDSSQHRVLLPFLTFSQPQTPLHLIVSAYDATYLHPAPLAHVHEKHRIKEFREQRTYYWIRESKEQRWSRKHAGLVGCLPSEKEGA